MKSEKKIIIRSRRYKTEKKNENTLSRARRNWRLERKKRKKADVISYI